MINFNGTLQDNSNEIIEKNRGFLYGDSVFETLKVVNNKIYFLEDHYLRLMASMRICRMEIPSTFTLEFFENEIFRTISVSSKSSVRVRFSVFRISEGIYFTKDKNINFLIQFSELEMEFYSVSGLNYEVELYKDFHVAKNLLSTLKTNNKMIHTLAGIFANENDIDNCLLINEEKNVIEAINGNIFMFLNNQLITPPISDGCQNGIIRKNIIRLAKDFNFDIIEKSISPFDLQKADELFISNVIVGIQPITKYRKKEYSIKIANEIINKLNSIN